VRIGRKHCFDQPCPKDRTCIAPKRAPPAGRLVEPALVTRWNERDEEVEMRSLARHLAWSTVATLLILVIVGTAFLASARVLTTGDPDICTTPVPAVGTEASFLAQNEAAMSKMMNDMAINPTGDVDRDFVAMMIPHHQGAIDMALAVLRHGRKPQIKRLAQEIIVTQQQEIAVMRLAADRPPPPRPSRPEER
jgi:hypothetical protein